MTEYSWTYWTLLAIIIGVPSVLGWLYRPGGYLNGPTSFHRRFAANRRP